MRLPADKRGASRSVAVQLRRLARLWAGVTLPVLVLTGCGLIPECICTQIQKPPEAPQAAAEAPPSPPLETPPPAAPSLPAAPLPPAVSQAPLTQPGPAPGPTALAPPARTPPQVSAAPVPPIGRAPPAGRYGAQLGAFKTLANANGAWDKFKARYIDLLNTVPGPLLREVDLGPRGKFVRVMAGPFNSEPEARSLCIEVQARGGFCYVQPLGR